MAVSGDPQRGHSVWSVAATATAESCGPRWAGEAAAGHQAPLRTRTGSLLSARTFTTSTRTMHPGKATRQEDYQHLPAGDTLLRAGEKKIVHQNSHLETSSRISGMLGTNVWDHTSRGLKVSLHSLEVDFFLWLRRPSRSLSQRKDLVLKLKVI